MCGAENSAWHPKEAHVGNLRLCLHPFASVCQVRSEVQRAVAQLKYEISTMLEASQVNHKLMNNDNSDKHCTAC